MQKSAYFILLFILVLISHETKGQLNNQFNSHFHAESTADAAQLDQGVYGLGTNIANIAFTNKFEVIGGVQNLFAGESGIFYMYLASSKSIGKDGGIGLGFSSLGNETYKEFRANLAYAHKLGRHTSLGLSLQGFSLGAEGYDRQNSATFQLSFRTSIYEKLFIGSSVQGLYYAGYFDRSDASSFISIHAAYHVTEELKTFIDITKQWNSKTSFSGGIRYQILEKLYVSAGFKVNPSLLSFGIGIPLNKLNFGISSRYLTEYGLAPGAHFAYNTQNF